MGLAFDEMKGTDGQVRAPYSELANWLGDVKADVLDYRRREAELLFRRIGITFAVYGEADSTERLIPFDVIPRILGAKEWDLLRRGLEQRVRAINEYLRDVYGRREVLRAGIVPEDLVFQNPVFRPEMNGQKVPHNIYVHIAGIDIVRVDPETFYVLEDNARTPSGVSYMLENREIMMRLFPELFARHRVAPVENYPDEPAGDADIGRAGFRLGRSDCGAAHAGRLQLGLLRTLVPCRQARHRAGRRPRSVCQKRPRLHAHHAGPKRVDVIYRRVDDDFLDPLSFRADSALGVAGLMSAYQAGNVDAGQRRGHRHRRRQGDLQLHARRS